MVVLPNGNILCDDLRVWDINAGKCVQHFFFLGLNVMHCFAVLPNGWVVGGNDHTIVVWDDNARLLKTLHGHESEIWCIAVLPNGWIISGSDDKTLKVWDCSTGDCKKTLKGHESGITSVAILPNGSVISGSGDMTLKIWDISTSQCLETFHEKEEIGNLAVLPNGTVISGSRYKLNVRIGEKLQSEYQIRKAARIIGQSYRGRCGLFSTFPIDLSYKIAGYTGKSGFHPEEKASEIAKRYFDKP
jgi:WD40 repeat protein